MKTPTPFTEADWARLERDWTAWWNHDLDRPLLVSINTRPTDRVRPSWWGGLGQMPLTVPAEEIAAELWDDISRTTHHGDSWPRAWMNYGPGIGAAALWFAPGNASAGAWAVSGLLTLGFGGLFWLRARSPKGG